MTPAHDLGSNRLPWVVVGYGKIGQTLVLLADDLDADIRATWNRTQNAADNAEVPSPNPLYGELPKALGSTLDTPCLVWLTVVDDAIEEVFAQLDGELASGSVVVHTSGSLPSTELAATTDHLVASLHPLQAVSDPRAAVRRLPRSFWTVEGDDRAVDYLQKLLAPAGIDPVRIEAHKKTLYHASAATAANLLVSLIDAAISIAEAADIDTDTARSILVDLADSSLQNLADNPPHQALTGPAARGDMEVIDRHRRALAELDDDSLAEIYELLTQRALDGLSD